jgi:hypothetical protein
VGCHRTFSDFGSDDVSKPIVSISCESNTEYEKALSLPTADRDDTLILVTSSGEKIAPYIISIWDETWTESGWLSADYMSLYFKLREIASELPVVSYSDDFTVQYEDSVSLKYISIYNVSFEQLHHNVDLTHLQELKAGTYYIGITVAERGIYIESEDKYESHGYDCACKLIIDAEIEN